MVELDNADDDLGDEERADDEHAADEHLEEVADGCGCTEIWEHLSEQRADD
ncbi:hypothetical protein [Halosimplex salinum]|uniref:hypothetical protein n=1 Tax=Halosimplex salinum TaxID=1710538 RepID=UPI0013DE608C|nr:hypothetical protein [Halosimplex salinum]